MDYTIAAVATNWWLAQLKNRCKQLHPDKVIENDSEIIIVDDCLKDELSRFEEMLLEEILRHTKKGLYLSLTCCYYPNGDLKTLVRKARISRDYFPVRAHMQICKNCVEVSLDGNDLQKLPLSTDSL